MSIRSAQSLYRSYCNVVARWPLDKSKTSRDLAVFIHDRVNLLFPNGDRTEINDQTRLKSIQDEIEALNRIVSDHHRLSVSMKNVSASSGLKLEELQSINSTESLKQMKDIYAKGFIYNFTNDLKLYFRKKMNR